MKRALIAMAAALWAAAAQADFSGFVQLREVPRVQPASDCASSEACDTMAQELRGELLVEQDLGDTSALSVRGEGVHDDAVSSDRFALREGFVDWSPVPDVDFRMGRQVLTWGVSDNLHVNDVFPKNYDASFTGGGSDRMKEAVDAARVDWHLSVVDVEAVVARAKADRLPEPSRFEATTMLAAAEPADDADDAVDSAVRVSANVQGWDLAAYSASLRSREQRHFVDATGLRSDRPRLTHVGLSVTGNAAAGVVWIEAGARHASKDRVNVVARHFLGSSARLIFGYSREVGQGLTASAQLQGDLSTSYDRYVAALAPGVRKRKRLTSMLHLRLQGSWMNQTLVGGAQLFAGNEDDLYFNPFTRWSPADGWTIEAGANLFNGSPETRYGAFEDDSNAYALGRYSF
jgi:hypothetical protein